jgi:hypothetical protein
MCHTAGVFKMQAKERWKLASSLKCGVRGTRVRKSTPLPFVSCATLFPEPMLYESPINGPHTPSQSPACQRTNFTVEHL